MQSGILVAAAEETDRYSFILKQERESQSQEQKERKKKKWRTLCEPD
jgi:hypothetical protein